MQELGPNSYMVTVQAEEVEGGKKAARRRAVDEAVKACTAQGKHMHPTHMTGGISDFILEGEIELNFRCEDHPSPDPY